MARPSRLNRDRSTPASGPGQATPDATAASALPVLWDGVTRGGPTPLPAPEAAAQVRRLAQELGLHAMQGVADALAGERDALAQSSASLLQTLLSLWAACGLAPGEIWTELHKRELLGSLLMQLNQAQSQAPRRLLKPWRIDSTKLP